MDYDNGNKKSWELREWIACLCLNPQSVLQLPSSFCHLFLYFFCHLMSVLWTKLTWNWSRQSFSSMKIDRFEVKKNAINRWNWKIIDSKEKTSQVFFAAFACHILCSRKSLFLRMWFCLLPSTVPQAYKNTHNKEISVLFCATSLWNMER